MSGTGNSGTEGAFDPERIPRKIGDLRALLDDIEIVGFPKRDTELAELERLVCKYPAEAREILGRLDDGNPAGPTG